VTSNLYRDLGRNHKPIDVPARALAIGAHPDDIEFGCGGTLAGWAAAGCEVTMVVVTDGSKGSWDATQVPAELARLRAAEQEAAAATLGAARVIRLDYVDGELEYSMDLRRRMAEQIRLARPEVLFSHDPWQRYQVHPDHRATGLGAVDGMVAARDPLFFPEMSVAAHRPAAMLLWSADAPDHWQDIAGSIDTKITALLCHSSQGETTMGNAHDGGDARVAFEERIKKWAARNGAEAGIDLAEAFKRLTP
jgi:LmbE family N-acetylglucosaminyl deacetylase